MNFIVTSENNFCRVFRLPDKFSRQFCFGGPIPHAFFMVDWFNPCDNTSMDYPADISLQAIAERLVPWLQKKPYVKAGHTYLVLCDFGAAFTFTGESTQ